MGRGTTRARRGTLGMETVGTEMGTLEGEGQWRHGEQGWGHRGGEGDFGARAVAATEYEINQ